MCFVSSTDMYSIENLINLASCLMIVLIDRQEQSNDDADASKARKRLVQQVTIASLTCVNHRLEQFLAKMTKSDEEIVKDFYRE